MQGVHVDFEFFFSPIGLSNDKRSVTEIILLFTSKRRTILLILRENLFCGLVLLLKQAVINDKIT